MPIRPPAAGSPAPDVLSPNGANQRIAQRHQAVDPARRAAHHALRGMPGVERPALDADTESVDELRAGQQRGAIDIGLDLIDLHGGANLFASRQKRKTRSTA